MAFGLCAGAALVPLWSVKYLPMVDLPQHAALVSAWLHLGDPAYGFADQFEAHPFTPYVLTYLAAMGLAKGVGILCALKLLVTLGVLGLPLATLRMTLRRGGDPWWALWAFPLAFGVSFYWGFVSYLLAAPLGVTLVDEGDSHARAPTPRSAAKVAVLAVALFFTHLVVLAAAVAIVGALVLLRSRGVAQALARLSPLGAPAALTAIWAVVAAGRDDRVAHWEWMLTWRRLTMLPEFLFGAPFPVNLSVPAIDDGAAMLAVVFATCLALARPSPSRELSDWAPALAVAAFFLLGPFSAFSAVLVADRFSLLILPFTFTALRAGPDSPPRGAARALGVVAIVAWMGVLALGFRAWNEREMAPFERISSLVGMNRSVSALVFDASASNVNGTPALMHVGGFIQAEKGGVFAGNYGDLVNLPVQYRPGKRPAGTPGVALDPTLFDWNVDGAADYFIVRSPVDPAALFAKASAPVVLVARDSGWWLFRHLRGS
jgi:hypothetical protein